MIKVIAFAIFIFLVHLIYSQTEQDYFEMLRVHRHDLKIKKIIAGDFTDFFDEDGYHIKREFLDKYNNTHYASIIKHLTNGNLSVDIDLGPEGKFTTVGSQALFYHTYFDPYNLIDNDKMIVDELNRVKEEVLTGTDYEGSDYFRYYYENSKMYPIRSEFYNETKLISTTNYFYDNNDLLLKEETIEVTTGKSYTKEYTYEYY